MKTLVFSDSHLTHKFDSEWFDYIKKLIKSADQVVINGDFWDGYLTTFDAFCKSKWKKLFPLLKKKNTVYVLGNHDKKEFMDERVNLFSNVQTLEHVFKSGNKNFIVQHGHLISPAEDKRFIFRNPEFTRPIYTLFVYLKENFSFFEKLVNNIYLEKKDAKQHLEVRKYATKKRKKNTYFIFGHSHVFDFDSELKFISCALTNKSKYSYVFITNGKIDYFCL